MNMRNKHLHDIAYYVFTTIDDPSYSSTYLDLITERYGRDEGKYLYRKLGVIQKLFQFEMPAELLYIDPAICVRNTLDEFVAWTKDSFYILKKFDFSNPFELRLKFLEICSEPIPLFRSMTFSEETASFVENNGSLSRCLREYTDEPPKSLISTYLPKLTIFHLQPALNRGKHAALLNSRSFAKRKLRSFNKPHEIGSLMRSASPERFNTITSLEDNIANKMASLPTKGPKRPGLRATSAERRTYKDFTDKKEKLTKELRDLRDELKDELNGVKYSKYYKMGNEIVADQAARKSSLDPFVSVSTDERLCTSVATNPDLTGISVDRVWLYRLEINNFDAIADNYYNKEIDSSGVLFNSKDKGFENPLATITQPEFLIYLGVFADEISSCVEISPTDESFDFKTRADLDAMKLLEEAKTSFRRF